MNQPYRIIIKNENMYKEFKICTDRQDVKLGTDSMCSLRLSAEYFREPVQLTCEQEEKGFKISCGENLYIEKDGKQERICSLLHEDEVSVCYWDTKQEAFQVKLRIDFESEIQNYDVRISVDHLNHFIIGTADTSDLMIKSKMCSYGKIELIRENGNWYIQETESEYGVYLNGIKLKQKAALRNSDFIMIADAALYYKREHFYFSEKNFIVSTGKFEYLVNRKNSMQYPLFNRSTRLKMELDEEPIEVLFPPDVVTPPKRNIVMSLLPAIIMLAVTIIVRGFMSGSKGTLIIVSVISMSLGIFTSIVSFITEGREYRKQVTDRREKYIKYIEEKKQKIAEERRWELEILNDTYIDLERSAILVEDFDGRLFERIVTDQDFLYVYIGKGQVKSKKEITYKRIETYDIGDELFELPKKLETDYQYLESAPIVVDFQYANAVGVVGEKNNRHAMFKNMILDLAVRQYYSDVRIFVVLGEKGQEKFSWLGLMPHLYRGRVRNIACDSESKNSMFEYLYRELSSREEQKESGSHIVIFVLEEMGIKNHPLSQYISHASDLHTTFVFFEKEEEQLPLYCKNIISLQTEMEGYLVDTEHKDKKKKFRYSEFADEKAVNIVRRLAPIHCEEISLESSLRKSISLFELLGIYSVKDIDLKQRWQASEIDKSMAAPLGINAKDEIVSLDLHEKYHGPHGLVAGTTGSGKSEILQSYILSAATLYHPYELGFVIIDFKGGGMVNQFKNLPHLIGAITNIDGKEIDRSLKSIKAELLKRQELFAEAGVNHIDKYIRLYKEGKVKTALPHLVIIVDEFAELKAEQPEFMKELISAARIGRSLGVHLILATQKPAGQVNDQIWSNSKFKLCLKVQTREDSNEVLKTPVAAEIREPGRAYLQVGNNEVFELFQSGFSGASEQMDDKETKSFTIYEVEFSGKKHPIYRKKKNSSAERTRTQLEAIVDYVQEYCEKESIKKLPDICLPPLEQKIYYPKKYKKPGETQIIVPIGIFDNPDCQMKGKADLNLTSDNVMIIGSAQYGKTNLLQTMIRGISEHYTPKEVQFYIIDFASMVLKNFEKLNHCGGVVCTSEDEKLKNLFKLLQNEIETRKQKMLATGVSSFSAYREAGYIDLPQIILFIDNLTALKELYLQDNDILIQLSREGLSSGISIVVANAQLSGIGYRYLSNFSGRIALYCNDSNEYNSLFDYCKMKPDNQTGRCLIEMEKEIYECQTYLAFSGEKEIERVEEIKRFTEEVNKKYGRVQAKQIPEIPPILWYSNFTDRVEEPLKDYQTAIGLDYKNVEPRILDISALGTLVLTGNRREERENFVRNILCQLGENCEQAPLQTVIIDDIEKHYACFEGRKYVKEYTISAERVRDIILEWQAELSGRYEALMQGKDEVLKEASLLFMVVQNPDVITAICSDKICLAAYQEIVKKYKNLKVCIVFAEIPNASIAYSAPDILKGFKEERRFWLFDDLQNCKVCDLPMPVLREFKKQIEAYDAYEIRGNEVSRIKTIKNV